MSILDNWEDVRYSKSQNNTWNKLVADSTRDEGYHVIETIEEVPANEEKFGFWG